jgi:ribosomal protein S6
MRTYELMVILKPEFDPGDEKKIKAVIAKLLGAQAKAIVSTEIVGKKHLSYPIQKMSEGTYTLTKLNSARIDLSLIEKQVKLMPEILRQMVTLAKE